MKLNTFKKIEIQNELELLPQNKLDDVKKFIDDILSKSHIKKPKPKSLIGIWNNLGFDKITNLQKEINDARKSISNSILNRMFKCSAVHDVQRCPSKTLLFTHPGLTIKYYI